MLPKDKTTFLYLGYGITVGGILLAALSLSWTVSFALTAVLLSIPVVVMFPKKKKLFVAAYIFCLPLSIAIPLGSASTASFRLYLSDILALLIIGIYVAESLMAKTPIRPRFGRARYYVPLLLWIAMALLSMIPAVSPTAAFGGSIRIGRVLLAYLCITPYLKQYNEKHFVMRCLQSAFLVQSMIMITQFATGKFLLRLPGMAEDFGEGDISEQGIRPQGTMGHSSNFAKFSGLLIPSALSGIFFSAQARQKLFSLITWVAGSVAVVLTISRAGIVTWMLTPLLLGLALVYLRMVNFWKVIALTVIPLVLCVAIAGMAAGDRIASRVKDDEGSLSLRKPMWAVALNIIKAHPLLGVGVNNYILVHRRYDHGPENISVRYPVSPVHNLYLLYAAEMGVPGLLLFLWFVGLLLWDSLSLAKRSIRNQDKLLYLVMAIGTVNLLLQSVTGKGVADHPIHLSILGIFLACVSANLPEVKTYALAAPAAISA